MLRASSLGLHLPTTTIPTYFQCLRAPRAAVINRTIKFSITSALHCSTHPRSTNDDERARTETIRVDGTLCPAAFPSLVKGHLVLNAQIDSYAIPDLKGMAPEEEGEFIQEPIVNLNLPVAEEVNAEQMERDGQQTVTSNYIIQDAPSYYGRPWQLQHIKPIIFTSVKPHRKLREIAIPSLEEPLEDVENIYADMLYVLATTCSAEDGWKAYAVLSRLQQTFDISEDGSECLRTPFAYLHRLARVIAQNRPKTRSQFLRLLSVLTTIQSVGGTIHLHEWNALIDHAGKGWRKLHSEDFKNSLNIYHDMIRNRPPGSQFSNAGFDDILNPQQDEDYYPTPITPAAEPDIHTYTTLIDIAARTNNPPLLHHATTLLKQSKIPPNRITHLALLKYFTSKKQLSGVRSTLQKMRQQNLELGVDGLNACMWAYSRNKRVDVAMMIYRLLRHNMVPEEYGGEDNINSVWEHLETEEGIAISPNWRPNEVTFTLMVQVMAYHGNLLAALSVFIDMLSTPNREQGAPLVLDDNGDLQPISYSPTIHVFRALFLGFSRHGIDSGAQQLGTDGGPLEWNLDNLQNIFENFLQLPPETRVSETTIFWILNSFSRTSNHDMQLLRTVWQRTENRFGRFQGGSKHRLTKWRQKLFPEDSADSG